MSAPASCLGTGYVWHREGEPHGAWWPHCVEQIWESREAKDTEILRRVLEKAEERKSSRDLQRSMHVFS